MLVPLRRFFPARLRLQPEDLRRRIALHRVLEQRLRHSGIRLRLPMRQRLAEMLAQRRFGNRLTLRVVNEAANHILPHPAGHEGFDKTAVLISRGEGGTATHCYHDSPPHKPLNAKRPLNRNSISNIPDRIFQLLSSFHQIN